MRYDTGSCLVAAVKNEMEPAVHGKSALVEWTDNKPNEEQ